MCQKFVDVFNKQQDVLFISSYILNQLSSNLDDKQRDQLRLTHIGSRVGFNSLVESQVVFSTNCPLTWMTNRETSYGSHILVLG